MIKADVALEAGVDGAQVSQEGVVGALEKRQGVDAVNVAPIFDVDSVVLVVAELKVVALL